MKISLETAKHDKLFYVVANAVVYRETDRRCLILHRSKTEKVHPEKWAVVGGKLEWSDLDLFSPGRMNGDVLDYPDALRDLLLREAKEEAGIVIDHDLRFVNTLAFVRPDGIPTVLVKFAVRYLSGEVVLEAESFDDFAWVNAEEVKAYDTLLGIPEEVEKAIRLFA